MQQRIFYCLSVFVGVVIFLPHIVFAESSSTFVTVSLNQESVVDTDSDGVTDENEVVVYHTDPMNADTDGDGFSDGNEILKGYSPLQIGKKMSEVDTDQDGVNDAAELALHTDLKNEDTDHDGFSDGHEVLHGYDPRTNDPIRPEKILFVHLKTQELAYTFDGVEIGRTKVSTGKASTPTPVGTYTIAAKKPKAWSASAKLWMPWWMNFVGNKALAGKYALHELPEWPNGKKEGASHLGIPVSHGCVRLGVDAAKKLYEWTPVGTKVVVTKL